MGLHLFFLPNFPGATFIPDSRVMPEKANLKYITNSWPLNLQNFFSTPFSWPQYPGKIQNYTRTNFSHSRSEQLWEQNTTVKLWKIWKQKLCNIMSIWWFFGLVLLKEVKCTHRGYHENKGCNDFTSFCNFCFSFGAQFFVKFSLTQKRKKNLHILCGP